MESLPINYSNISHLSQTDSKAHKTEYSFNNNNTTNNINKSNDNSPKNTKLFESFVLFQQFLDNAKKSLQYNDIKVSSPAKLEKSNNEISKDNLKFSILPRSSSSKPIKKDFLNYDDIPVKNTKMNFLELVEKNWENEKRENSKDNVNISSIHNDTSSFTSFKNTTTCKPIQNTNASLHNPKNIVKDRRINEYKSSINSSNSLKEKKRNEMNINHTRNRKENNNQIKKPNKRLKVINNITKENNDKYCLSRSNENNIQWSSNYSNNIKNINNITVTSNVSEEIIYNYSSVDDPQQKTITNDLLNKSNISLEQSHSSCPHVKKKATLWNEWNSIQESVKQVNNNIRNINWKNSTLSATRQRRMSSIISSEFKWIKQEWKEIQKQKDEFEEEKRNYQRELDKKKEEFEEWKRNEIKIIEAKSGKTNTTASSNKEWVEQLKLHITNIWNESKAKDKANKLIISQLKKQVLDANNTISDWQNKIHSLSHNTANSINNKNNFNNNNNNNVKHTSVFNCKSLDFECNGIQDYMKQMINDNDDCDKHKLKTKIRKTASMPRNTLASNSNNIYIKHPSNIKIKSKKNSNNQKFLSSISNSICDDENQKITISDEIYNDNKEVSDQSSNTNQGYNWLNEPKYKINKHAKISNKEQTRDGKNIWNYTDGAREIIFPSGIKEQIFPDGFKIIYFTNKDVKQVFPSGKFIYFFHDSKITQTFLPETNTHIYKYKNGIVEKYGADGKREIIVFKK